MRYIFILLLFVHTESLVAFSLEDSIYKTKLIAQKGSKTQSYKIGQDIVIWYIENDKTLKSKGFIKSITNDSVTLLSFNKKRATQESIAIKDIDAISKAYRKQQKGFLIAFLVLIGLSIPLGILLLTSNPLAGAWIGVLFAIPLVGAFYALFAELGVLLLVKVFSKKSKKKGWHFRVE